MAASIGKNVICRLQFYVTRFEQSIGSLFGNQWPPLGPALSVAGQPAISLPNEAHNTEDNIGLWDGLLWAVPKKRRSKERNRTRRRAVEKRIKAVPYMTMCDVCGHAKRLNFLCGNCLTRIREESKEIQDKIVQQWEDTKDGIPDKDISVLYEGEQPQKQDEGKDIVEIKKKRPSWFPRELFTNIKH